MKRRSRLCAIALSFMLMLSIISGSQFSRVAAFEANVKPVNEVIAKELPNPEDMYIDRDNYHGQVLTGYYNFNCVVTDSVSKEKYLRTAKFYIPENSALNQPTVVVVVPSGMGTWEFLVKSGWKQNADQEKINIVLAEPGSGGAWGDARIEDDYLTSLMGDIAYRPYFCSFEAATYAIGYGDGSSVLQKNAMDRPKSYAAIGLIGAKGLSASREAELKAKPSGEAGVKISQVQMPIWIAVEQMTDDARRLINYFKSANHSQAMPVSTDTEFASELYLPMAGGNLDEEWCAKVFADTGDWHDYLTPGFAKNIFRKLFYEVRRYPGNGNNFLRSFEDIYKAGFAKYTGYVAGGYEEDGSDLYNRTWFVYKPKSVKQGDKAPVVFVFHGAGGSGDEIAGRSGWKQVADKYGLILVCPTGSHTLTPRYISDMWTTELMRAMWNTGAATEGRPSDLKFVAYLRQWAEQNYNIDTTRIYAAGQSSGGAMSHAVALFLPKIFAGSMPVSAQSAGLGMGGGFDPYSIADESSIVPIINFIGEKDPAFSTAGFGSSDGKKLIDYYTNRYQTVETFITYTYLNNGQTGSVKDGFFSSYLFRTPAGVPLIRGVEVATSVHAIWPSESFIAWKEFFSKYSKDAQGNLYYNGQLVTIP